jgi:hypothetical protein
MSVYGRWGEKGVSHSGDNGLITTKKETEIGRQGRIPFRVSRTTTRRVKDVAHRQGRDR